MMMKNNKYPETKEQREILNSIIKILMNQPNTILVPQNFESGKKYFEEMLNKKKH